MRNMLRGFLVALVLQTGLGAVAAATIEEVATDISPAFIGASNRLWAVKKTSPTDPTFRVVYSTDNATTWINFGSPLPADVSEVPSSIFVHSSGAVFVAEAPKACSGARIFRMDTGGQLTVIRNLDVTATVLPWGWTEDGAQNLYAAQYGVRIDAPCATGHPVNVSYVLKIAEPSGVPSGTAGTTSSWSWPTCGTSPQDCFAAWIAPLGAAADLHIHNLRYDPNRSTFVINSGDSPRATMTWNGNLATTPSLLPNCCSDGFLLTGFTGSAPMSDALYVGDDWTANSGGRGNSIRKLLWSGSNLVPPSSRSASIVYTMQNSFDTPIWDIHSSSDLELWFVNYDEATATEPSVRLSGLHVLRRTVPSYPNFATPATAVASAQSSWRNFRYIAADRFSQIPGNMPYIFVQAIHDDPNPANRYTVLMRISRN